MSEPETNMQEDSEESDDNTSRALKKEDQDVLQH